MIFRNKAKSSTIKSRQQSELQRPTCQKLNQLDYKGNGVISDNSGSMKDNNIAIMFFLPFLKKRNSCFCPEFLQVFQNLKNN